jgi:hypothetical protein
MASSIFQASATQKGEDFLDVFALIIAHADSLEIVAALTL